MSSKKPDDNGLALKNTIILPIDKKQIRDLKSRGKTLVDTLNNLGNALKKAAAAHEDFCSLVPPQLEGITHALQSIEEAQHKKRKRAEKDPDAPKKPATSYFLFSNAIRPKVKEEHPEMDQQALASLMGTKWKALTAEERKVWEDKAQLAKEKYAEEDKAYKAHKATQGPKPEESSEDEDDEEDEEESEEEERPVKKSRKDAASPSKSIKADNKKAAEKKKDDKKPTTEKKKDAKGKEKATPTTTPTKKDGKKAEEKKKGKK